MTPSHNAAGRDIPGLTNGSGTAAVLSAAVGCFVLAVLAIFNDKSTLVRGGLNFYKPTGPLSGVTTVAVVVWLFTWCILDWRWRKKTVAAAPLNAIAFALLLLSFMLTFPPFGDLF